MKYVRTNLNQEGYSKIKIDFFQSKKSRLNRNWPNISNNFRKSDIFINGVQREINGIYLLQT